MTRKISVELVGDDASLQRAFKRSSHGAKTFERDIGKASRGAIAASLSFKGLGRSVAFASGYLIGGAGLAYGLKSSVEGAESLEKAQRSLGVVIRRNGGNFRDQLPQIEEWAAAQARFGVSTVQSEQGLARATVITGSAVKGMRAYTEALEISKATGKSFQSVLLAAAKANEGQTTALARYIGKIPKGTSALKLFTDVQAKYSGQAAANTSATEKLSASLKNVETTVGTALLPTINKYADELTAWLGKSKNQERLQRDVNQVMRDAKQVFAAISGVVKTATTDFGGLKKTLEVLAGIKLASVMAGWLPEVAAVGSAAAVSKGQVAGLRRSLLGLNGITIAPIVIPIEEKVQRSISGYVKTSAGSKAASAYDYFTGFFSGGAVGKNPIGAILNSGAKDSYVNKPGYGNTSGMSNDPMHDAAGRAATAASGRVVPRGAGLDGLSSIQDAVSAARVNVSRGTPGAKKQLVAALRVQIDYDRKYEAVQKGLIKNRVGDVKKHAQTLQRLQADEVGALDEITAINTKTQNAEDTAAKKAAAAAKKRRDAAKKRADKAYTAARTFTVPINLRIAQAQAAATPETTDDVKVARAIATYALKVINSNKKKGQALVDAWNEITNQMQVFSGKQTQGGVAASSAMLTAGLHLSGDVRRALEARFAQAEAHSGRVPVGHAVGGVTIGAVHVHGVQNSDQLIAQIQKKARHAAVQTRGPNAGRNPRVH